MVTVECEICGRASGDSIAYCHNCAHTLHTELLAIPGLIADLHTAADRQDKLTTRQEGGKSPEPPLPIRLARDGNPTNYQRHITNVTEVISAWAQLLADTTAHDFDPATPPAGLTQLVHNNRTGHTHRHDPTALNHHPVLDVELHAIWLAHHITDIRRHPHAVTMHLDITDTTDTIRTLVDRPTERTFRGHCPTPTEDDQTCGAELRVERGEQWVRCPRCHAHHMVRQLDAQALDGLEDRAFTVLELLRLMRELGEPVPKATLYAWANDPRKRRLTPTDTDDKGRALYRLGDVRALRTATLEAEHASMADRTA